MRAFNSNRRAGAGHPHDCGHYRYEAGTAVNCSSTRQPSGIRAGSSPEALRSSHAERKRRALASGIEVLAASWWLPREVIEQAERID